MRQTTERALESKLDQLLRRVGPRPNPDMTLRHALAVREAVESGPATAGRQALIKDLRERLREQIDADLGTPQIWLASDGHWCSIEENMRWYVRQTDAGLSVACIRSLEAVEPVARFLLDGESYVPRLDAEVFLARSAW